MHNSATTQDNSEVSAERQGPGIPLPPQEAVSAVPENLEDLQPSPATDSSGDAPDSDELLSSFSFPDITPEELVELSLIGHEIYAASREKTKADFEGERQKVFIGKDKLEIFGLHTKNPLIIDAYNALLPKPFALFLGFRVQQIGFKEIDGVIREIIERNLLESNLEAYKQYIKQLSDHDTIECINDDTCRYTFFVTLAEKTLYHLSVDIVKKSDEFILQKPDGKPCYKFYAENLPEEYDCIKQFFIPNRKLDDQDKTYPFDLLSANYTLYLMSVQQLPSKLDQEPRLIKLRPTDAQEDAYYIWGMNTQGVWEYCLLDNKDYSGVDFNHDSIYLSKENYETLYYEIEAKQAHCSNKHLCEIFREAQQNNAYSKIAYPAYNSAEEAGIDIEDWPLDEQLKKHLPEPHNSENANDTSQNLIQTKLEEIRNEDEPDKIISKLRTLKNEIAKQNDSSSESSMTAEEIAEGNKIIDNFVKNALEDKHVTSRLKLPLFRDLTKEIVALAPVVAADIDREHFMTVLSDEDLLKQLKACQTEQDGNKFQQLWTKKYKDYLYVAQWLIKNEALLEKEPELKKDLKDLLTNTNERDKALKRYIYDENIGLSIRRENFRVHQYLRAKHFKQHNRYIKIPCDTQEELYKLICLLANEQDAESDKILQDLILELLNDQRYRKSSEPSMSRMIKELLENPKEEGNDEVDENPDPEKQAKNILKGTIQRNYSYDERPSRNFVREILKSTSLTKTELLDMAKLNHEAAKALLEKNHSLTGKQLIEIALANQSKNIVYDRIFKTPELRSECVRETIHDFMYKDNTLKDRVVHCVKGLWQAFFNPKRNYQKALSRENVYTLFVRTDERSMRSHIKNKLRPQLENSIIEKLRGDNGEAYWNSLEDDTAPAASNIIDVLKDTSPEKIKRLRDQQRKELITKVFTSENVEFKSLANYFFLLQKEEEEQFTPDAKANLLASNPENLVKILKSPKPEQLEKLLNNEAYKEAIKSNPDARQTFLTTNFFIIEGIRKNYEESKIPELFDSLKKDVEELEKNAPTTGEGEQSEQVSRAQATTDSEAAPPDNSSNSASSPKPKIMIGTHRLKNRSSGSTTQKTNRTSTAKDSTSTVLTQLARVPDTPKNDSTDNGDRLDSKSSDQPMLVDESQASTPSVPTTPQTIPAPTGVVGSKSAFYSPSTPHTKAELENSEQNAATPGESEENPAVPTDVIANRQQNPQQCAYEARQLFPQSPATELTL